MTLRNRHRLHCNSSRAVQVQQNLDKRLEWHLVIVEIWRKCGKNHKKCDFSNLRRNWATLKESPFFQSSICHNSRPSKLKIHKVKKQTTKIDLMVALFRVLPKLAILTIFTNSQFFIRYRLFHKKSLQHRHVWNGFILMISGLISISSLDRVHLCQDRRRKLKKSDKNRTKLN